MARKENIIFTRIYGIYGRIIYGCGMFLNYD